MTMSTLMKAVKFSSVPVGGWFLESLDSSTWYLKTSTNTGMYQRFGTRYEPTFKDEETVFMEDQNVENN